MKSARPLSVSGTLRSAVTRSRRTAPAASVPYMTEAASVLWPRPRAWPSSWTRTVSKSYCPAPIWPGRSSVPGPTLNQGNLTRVRRAAQDAVGVAAHGDCWSPYPGPLGRGRIGHLDDGRAVRRDHLVHRGDHFLDPGQLVGREQAGEVVHVQELVAGQQAPPSVAEETLPPAVSDTRLRLAPVVLSWITFVWTRGC